MKNSKEYSKKIISLYQSLKSGKNTPKIPPPGEAVHARILDAVIYGIVSEKFSLKETESALKQFSEYFVDWNDLRVSRIEEIAEMLGADTPENRQNAMILTKVLQRVFNENHQMSMESLRKLGKRQARQKLEKIEELSKFVVDYCMLTALDSHAIPITEKMIEYLKRNELVDEHADGPTIEGFLSKQISAKNGYEFYMLLRNESETARLSSSKSQKATRRSPAVPATQNEASELLVEARRGRSLGSRRSKLRVTSHESRAKKKERSRKLKGNK
jgi:hypothetical protein